MALLLDAANIIGGLLLAIPLLGRFPAIGRAIGHITRWRWLIGIVALVAGGYYLIVHLISGPHLFHFEVVGIAVGVILAWERLTNKRPLVPAGAPGAPQPAPAEISGTPLIIAIFGIIAIIVGLQGLLTPN
ncbi:hypothetical protein [Actinoplanes utahensis]|uniref:Uncharacterized protein n=1 Tax=Actinoplanes utahensis TaxID=1869 RepID=A0A0A6UEE2_ACTUT|nr:hypothetical protein [Actinoplanes utahensis]KHD73443.1 hypothetical protein MB27_35175 [Actinoplanes utahensis]GIF30230.1 hypothetical protein Aut01nite_32160 [Actinoplanes utahensis]